MKRSKIKKNVKNGKTNDIYTNDDIYHMTLRLGVK